MEGQEIPWKNMAPDWQTDLQRHLGEYYGGKIGHMATPYEGPLGYGHRNEKGKLVAPDENMFEASQLMNRLMGGGGYTAPKTYDFHEFPSAGKGLKRPQQNEDPWSWTGPPGGGGGKDPDDPRFPRKPTRGDPRRTKDRFSYNP